MKSLSKIVKASKVILDNKKFRLSAEIMMPIVTREPEHTPSENEVHHPNHELELDSIHDHESFMERMRRESEEIIDNAAAEARARVEEAQKEHEKIVLEAYESAKEIMEKSREDGYKEGFTSGYADGMESAQSEIIQAREFKDDAIERYKNLVSGAEAEMVKIILTSVEKILATKIDEDEGYIQGLVKSAIEKCTYTENLVLRVSPDDYGYAIGLRDRIVTMFERIDQLDIRQDNGLVRGDCIVDSVSGSVDSSISTQVEQLRSTFEELLKSE